MKLLGIFLLMFAGAGAALAGPPGLRATAAEMKAVWTQGAPFEFKRKRIGELYPALEAAFPKDIPAAGTEELGALMEALNGAWYFLEDQGAVKKAEKVFGELARRRFATTDHVFAMQSMYIGAHRFGDASRIREDYPEIDTWAVPAEVLADAAVSSGPYRYYSVESGGKALRLGRAALEERPVIVFFGSPDCRFSVAALEALAAAPELKAALLSYGLFITTDDDFKELTAWNAAHPWKYLKVYSRKDWPGVKLAGAPEYTVFSKGVPVCSGRGWPEGETTAGFSKCLETAGLLTDAARMRAAVSGATSAAARDLPLEETRKLIADEYEALRAKGAFADAALAAYTAEDLAAAFDLLNFRSSGGRAPGIADILVKTYALLEKAGKGDAQKAGWVFDALLAERKFGAAKEFRSARPELKLAAVPEITGGVKTVPGRRLVYAMGPSAEKMRAESVGEAESGIVIAALPGCHFANYALAAIEKDPKLLKIFKKRGQLLTAKADFARILKRNPAKEIKYKLVASAEDWPGLDFDNSPGFYFIKGGKIVYSFSGWPKTGKMDELYIGLGRLGLLGD